MRKNKIVVEIGISGKALWWLRKKGVIRELIMR